MTVKTPMHWELDDDWKHGICNSCVHNSHERVQMVRQTTRTGNPDDEKVIEVWSCPACGYSREL
jgi:RNase P subunit RPR2